MVVNHGVDASARTEGNIVRSFSVKNAEVSAVAETISKALFE